LAAQLVIYLGWVRGGVHWAPLVGVCFVVPSLLIVFVLSALYVLYGGMSWIQGAFYGVGASVIAIIAMSSYKLVTKKFKKDKLLWSIGIVSAVVTARSETENLWLFLLGGVVVAFVRNPPKLGLKTITIFFPAFFLLVLKVNKV
jgi:chromate transporter